MIFLFLTSGFFLGWSLGANDAANIFGTSVATRMVRFRTAAAVSSVFIILGAVLSGGGATATLGELGSVNALGGSFMVALAAGVAVAWMTKAGLPVSVSQAIVGGIVGWNLFTGARTDPAALVAIVSTWVVCPLLAAAFAAGLYLLLRRILARARMHILELDALTRTLLLLVGAFGAYALGANNIANVVGVFVPAFPLRSIQVFGPLQITSTQILFFVGAAAIASGVLTYSQRVMMTVGSELFKLSPMAAFIVVLAESLVLILFASESLENWLVTHGLPTIPLVPVSSSQAVIGAVIGVALAKKGRGLRLGVLGRIAAGWAATPAISALVAFFGLFFLQNVFSVTVQRPAPYEVSRAVAERLAGEGHRGADLAELVGVRFTNARAFARALAPLELAPREIDRAFELSAIEHFEIDPAKMRDVNLALVTRHQAAAIEALTSRSFARRWEFHDALVKASSEWAFLPDTRANHVHNKRLAETLRGIYDAFRVTGTGEVEGE